MFGDTHGEHEGVDLFADVVVAQLGPVLGSFDK